MVQSRFFLEDRPVSLPGKCAVCGNPGNDERKFIDFGFSLDFYGVVYICTYCWLEGSQRIGVTSKEQFEESQRLLEEASARYAEMEAENVRLRVALSQLDFLRPDRSSGVSGNHTPESTKAEKQASGKSTKSTDGGGSSDTKSPTVDANGLSSIGDLI